jgi:hypothetical protein
MAAAAFPSESPSTPIASAGAWEPLFSTVATGLEKALAASGDWTSGDRVVDVSRARWLSLFVAYDAAAAAGYPHIIVMVSNAQDAPAVGDDSWFIPTVPDVSATDTTPDSAVPAGTDFTTDYLHGEINFKPLLIRTPAAIGASTETRSEIAINVSRYRWVQIMCAEKGVTGTPGSLLVRYALSA